MNEIWRMGPIAATVALGRLGFSWHEANRLMDLRRRFERGRLDGLTSTQKRLRFALWLVHTGRLSEGEVVGWDGSLQRVA